MSHATFNRSTDGLPTAVDPAHLAATLAEQRPEDVVDLLNQNKPGFAAAVLLASPDPKAVAVFDQPELRNGSAIASILPADRAARLLNQVSAGRRGCSTRCRRTG